MPKKLQLFGPLPTTSNGSALSKQRVGDTEGAAVGAFVVEHMPQAILQLTLPSGNLLQRLGFFRKKPHFLSPFPSTAKRSLESAHIDGASEGTAVGEIVGVTDGTTEGVTDGTSVSVPPHVPHATGQNSSPSKNLVQRFGFFLKNPHPIFLFFLTTKNLVLESKQQLSQATGHSSGPSGNRSHLSTSLTK